MFRSLESLASVSFCPSNFSSLTDDTVPSDMYVFRCDPLPTDAFARVAVKKVTKNIKKSNMDLQYEGCENGTFSTLLAVYVIIRIYVTKCKT